MMNFIFGSKRNRGRKSRSSKGFNVRPRGGFETLESRHLLSAMGLTTYDEVASNVFIERTLSLGSSAPVVQTSPNLLKSLADGDGLVFNFNPAQGMLQAAIDAFEEAGRIWSSVLLDNVTVNIDIDFKKLAPGQLGGTISVFTFADYADVAPALQADSLTLDDMSSVSSLQQGDDVDILINRTSNNPSGSGSATPYIDNDGDANNSQMRISRANAKALGLIDAEDSSLDATIQFSDDFTWDFNPYDGINAGAYDFVGVALHEIGHSLGFTSGVDILDVNSPPVNGPFTDNQFTYITTLDLFRYSQQSIASGVIDWTADARDKFFSIDGGQTSLGSFSTGRNFGDGQQASHWKDNLSLGLMDPTVAVGVPRELAELDLRAMDVIGWDKGFRVTSTVDSTDFDLSNVAPTAANGETTLRSTVQQANAMTTPSFIVLPAGLYNLTLAGTGGDTQGDLDITGNVTIVGAGAGATIINAGTLTGNNRDRIFQVTTSGSSLEASRITLTGGNALQTLGNSLGGGAIHLGGGAAVTLDQLAIVGNTTDEIGGAIRVSGAGSQLTVHNSVIAHNTSTWVAGGIAVGPEQSSDITIGSTVFAKNVSTNTDQENFYSDSPITNQGNNLVDSGPYYYFTATGDHVGAVDYVVTSLVDTFDHTDDARALSIREAISLANGEVDPLKDNLLEEIWMPAWSFVLTRERQGGAGTTDTDIAFGDLDITDKLKVRGVTGLTKVQWKLGVTDASFDLVGDYNGNGIAGGTEDDGGVNGSDFIKWQQQYGSGVGSPSLNTYSADGDDDGDVDGDDNTIRAAHYGNTFEIMDDSVFVILA